MSIEKNSTIEQSRNMPKGDAQSIPKGWVETTLGGVADIKYGKDHKKLNNGNIPCLGSGGIMRLVNEVLYDKPSVLIPRKGTLSNLFYIDKPFWTVDTLFYTEIDENFIIPKYLFFKLKTIKLEDLNVGSAVPSLTTVVLNQLPITIPKSIKEQKAIAQILTAFDDKIELLQVQNKTLETTAQTIFKEWFGKYQIGDELPEGWRVGKLREVVKKISKGTTPRKKDLEGLKVEIPFLKVKDISNEGLILKDNLELIPKKIHQNQLKRSILETNDILFSIAGTIGRVSIVNKELNNSNCNQALAFIRLKDKNKFKEYVRLWFKSKEIQGEINNCIVQGVQANISLTVLGNLAINIPNDIKMTEWNNLSKPIYQKIETNNAQTQFLKQTRDMLLPKLMSGQLRVDEFKERAV